MTLARRGGGKIYLNYTQKRQILPPPVCFLRIFFDWSVVRSWFFYQCLDLVWTHILICYFMVIWQTENFLEGLEKKVSTKKWDIFALEMQMILISYFETYVDSQKNPQGDYMKAILRCTCRMKLIRTALNRVPCCVLSRAEKNIIKAKTKWLFFHLRTV